MIRKISILILVFFCFGSISFSFGDDSNQKSEWDITGTGFMIDTSWSLFNFWNNSNNSLKQWTSTQTINNTLWTIIQKLMIALWFISAFIMTIWAWYMILYHGQDEFLTKWKNIFMAWIISLVVALASYQLVSFIRFILYS